MTNNIKEILKREYLPNKSIDSFVKANISNDKVEYIFKMINGEERVVTYDSFLKKKIISKKGISIAPMIPTAIQRNNVIYITEGESDGLSLMNYTSQIMIMPGANSSSCILKNVDEIKNQIGSPQSFHILYDNDQAGSDGAIKLAHVLVDLFPQSKTYIYSWTDDSCNDIRDLIKKDGKEFRLDTLRVGRKVTALSLLAAMEKELKNKECLKLPIDYSEINKSLIYSFKLNDQLNILESKEGKIQTYNDLDNINFDIISKSPKNYIESASFTLIDKFSDPIKQRDIFEDLKSEIIGMCYFQDSSVPHLLACYILMTYIYPIFSRVPYICLKGPRGTGKTTLSSLMASLCFNGEIQSNSSKAAIRRWLHDKRGTYVFDDAEIFSQTSSEMQEFISLLNSSYSTKFTSMICDGDKNREKAFYMGGPKIFNAINMPQKDLLSRMIMFETIKAPGTVRLKTNTISKESKESWRSRCIAWAILNYSPILKHLQTLQEVSSSSRDSDLLNPLLAVCSVFSNGNEYISEVKKVFKKSQTLKMEKVDIHSLIIATVINLASNIESRGILTTNTNDILEELTSYDEEEVNKPPQRLKSEIGTVLRTHSSFVKSYRKKERNSFQKVTFYELNTRALMDEKASIPQHLLNDCLNT